jgi:SecY interacting protein Syd
MTSSNHTKNTLVDVLQQFSKQYVNQYQVLHSHLPKVDYDEEWPSVCEIPSESNSKDSSFLLAGEVFWQPVAIEAKDDLNFENVESALELTLNSDIKTYFTTIYSESIEARCEEGNLSLLFPWNENDFQRLQENVIGHIMMKQRLKQQETVFFAVTDEEDMIISVDNDTGSVWVERVGCNPHKKLAESLTEFISTLEPVIN